MQDSAFVLITDSEFFLSHLRAKDKKIGLPGGKIESGESPLNAAIRETKEEYNIDLDQNNLEELGYVEYNGSKLYLFKYKVDKKTFNKFVNKFIDHLPDVKNEILGPMYGRMVPEITVMFDFHPGARKQLEDLVFHKKIIPWWEKVCNE